MNDEGFNQWVAELQEQLDHAAWISGIWLLCCFAFIIGASAFHAWRATRKEHRHDA